MTHQYPITAVGLASDVAYRILNWTRRKPQMLVKFGKLEKPRKIAVDEESASPTFARFIAEPFERVFGHSIGNAMRRILLSSLETPGIISVRIEGVPHEFMAVEGIVEDLTNVILNFKG